MTKNPTDKISDGIADREGAERAARQRRFELLQKAPKDLGGLLALAKRSEEKHARIVERGRSLRDTLAKAKQAAKEYAAKNVIDAKRYGYVQDEVAKARASWIKTNDFNVKGHVGDTARLHAEVVEAHELASALIERYNSPIGLLQLSTSSGAEATKRRECLALMTTGPQDLKNQIDLALTEGQAGRARLAAAVQVINSVADPDLRRDLMRIATDGAHSLVGVELAAGRACIAAVAADFASADYHSAELRGVEVGPHAAIEVGLLRRQADALAEAVAPEPQPAE